MIPQTEVTKEITPTPPITPKPTVKHNNVWLWKLIALFISLSCLAGFGIYKLYEYKNSLDDQRLREGLQQRNFLVIKEIEVLIRSNPVGSFDHDKWKNLLCKAIPSHPYCGGTESSYGKDVETFLLDSKWTSLEGLLGACLGPKEKTIIESARLYAEQKGSYTLRSILEEVWHRYRFQLRRGSSNVGGKRGAISFFLTLQNFFPMYFSSCRHETLDEYKTWKELSEMALVTSDNKDWIAARKNNVPWPCWLEFVNSIRPEPLSD